MSIAKDKAIRNLRGKAPPNDKGEYLCNGNCNWNECNMHRLICEFCGYLSCERCGEDFDTAFHEYLKIDDDGDTFCRSCLMWNTDVYIN